MSTLIASQNFDGVVAPALPTGWTFDSNMATSIGQSTSVPNSLELSGTVSGGYAFASYNTVDGNNGNVICSCNFFFDPSPPALTGKALAGVAVQGSALPLSGGSTTFVWGYLDWVNQLAFIDGFSGSLDQIGVVNLAANTLVANAWYSITLSAVGSSPNATQYNLMVQRASDGQWLQPTGSFAAGFAAVISSTPIWSYTLPAGGGYSGIICQSNQSGQNVYCDDWTLTAPSATPLPQVTIVRVSHRHYPQWAE